MLGQGIYSFKDAARLTGLRQHRIRAWFKPRGDHDSVLVSDYESLLGRTFISFLDLVEVRSVGVLRQHGMSMQRIRRVHQNLRQLVTQGHPFAYRDLFTERLHARRPGRQRPRVSLYAQDERELVDLDNWQREWKSVLLPLLERLDFDEESALASRWHIAAGVVVDPALNFGRPTAAGAGITTEVLAAAYYANLEDAALVARWYGRSVEAVRAAVAFERS